MAKVSAALVLACGELENVVADSVNPHFRSKYAALPDLLDAVRPVLTKHGLAVVQMATSEDASPYRIGVETILLHSSGEYLSNTILVTPQKNDPQGAGSALTYCRRYALAAALGIGQEDDDGNGASGNDSLRPKSKRTPREPEPPEDPPEPKWLDEEFNPQRAPGKAWRYLARCEPGSVEHDYLRRCVEKGTGQFRERAKVVLAYVDARIAPPVDDSKANAENF